MLTHELQRVTTESLKYSQNVHVIMFHNIYYSNYCNHLHRKYTLDNPDRNMKNVKCCSQSSALL
jgi:hypothetical protein